MVEETKGLPALARSASLWIDQNFKFLGLPIVLGCQKLWVSPVILTYLG